MSTPPIQGTFTYRVMDHVDVYHNEAKELERYKLIQIMVQGKPVATSPKTKQCDLPALEATYKIMCNSFSVLNVCRKVIEEVEPCLLLNGSQRDAMQKLNKEVLSSTI